MKRYDSKNIKYRIPTPKVQSGYAADSTATIQLENVAVKGVIRYEIDKEKITDASPLYKKPIALKPGSVLHFATFTSNGKQSSTEYFPKKPKRKK